MWRRRVRWGLVCVLLVTLVACGGSTQEKRDRFFRKGEKLFQQGDYVRATLEIKNSLQVDPKFARGYYLLGMCAYRRNELKQAYGAFNKALELDPKLAEARVMRGRMLLLGGQAEKALAAAGKVLAAEPANQSARLLKGAALVRLGREADADAVFADLLKEGCKEPDLYILLANQALKKKNLAGARGYLEKLLGFSPEHRMARLLLVDVLEQQQQLESAEENLRILIGQQPADRQAEARLLLVKFYLRHKRVVEAESLLEKLVAENPDSERFRVLLVQFFGEQKQEDKSLAALREGLKKMPESLALTEMMVKYRLSRNETGAARKLLEEYLARMKTGPRYLRAKLMLARIAVQEQKFAEALQLVDSILKENHDDFEALVLRGDLLRRKKDFDGAIAAYRTVLKEAPKNLAVRYSLAQAHFGNQEPKLARDELARIVKQDPGMVPAALQLARLEQQQGHYGRALEIAEKALEKAPRSYELLEMTINLMVRRGRAADALKLCRNYLAKLPDDARLKLLEAQVLIAMRNFPPARKDLMQVLESDPDNRAALFNLVRLELLKGSPEEALARGRELFRKNPDSPVAGLLLANLYEQTGKFTEAAGIYRKILDKHPEAAVAANNLAYYYAAYRPTKANLAKAEKLLVPFIEKYRTEPTMMDTAAWVFYQNGKYEQALEFLHGVEEKIQQVPEALYHLAMIQVKLGDKEAAVANLKAALKSEKFPGRREAEVALRKLQQ